MMINPVMALVIIFLGLLIIATVIVFLAIVYLLFSIVSDEIYVRRVRKKVQQGKRNENRRAR